MIRRPPRATRTDTLFPYTTLFRSIHVLATDAGVGDDVGHCRNTPLEGSILPCCYAAGLRASMTRRLLRDVRKREVFIARLRLDRRPAPLRQSAHAHRANLPARRRQGQKDRTSTRMNSSH